MHDIQVSPRDLEPQQAGSRKRAERPIGVDDRKGANSLAMTLRPVELIPAHFVREQSRHGGDNHVADAPKERFADRRTWGNKASSLLLGLAQQLVDGLVVAMRHGLPPPFWGCKNVSAGTCRSTDQKLTKI